MSSTDGLNVELVQRQWEESQQLIGDLRTRLAVIASTSESAQQASTSIQASEASLARLTSDSAEMLGQLSQALSAAIESLRAMETALSKSDITVFGKTLESIAQDLAALVLKVSSLEVQIDSQASSLLHLKSFQEEAKQAREKQIEKIQDVLSTLPGRYRSRFDGIL